MKRALHPYAETSFFGQAIALAHATFYDALPSNVERKPPVAPANLPAKRWGMGGAFQRFAEALDEWHWRQRQKEREAYLAQSTDIYDLERRERELERSSRW